MADDLAEIALPLASGQVLDVAQTVSMERARTIITANEHARPKAYGALTDVLFVGCLALGLILLDHLDDSATCPLIKIKAFWEALCSFLEHKLGVVPIINLHHVLIGDRDRDGSTWPGAHLLHFEDGADI